MNYPRVSIITITYNHEHFIAQCIKSVLSQTYTNWEQIIIDDGSTDSTASVIARYKDPRIKYIYQDNIGIWRLGESYNRALNMTTGEIVAILEGDDFWPPEKLASQVPVFDDSEVVLCFGKSYIANSRGEIIYSSHSYKTLEKYTKGTHTQALGNLLKQNFITACTAVCRRSTLEEIGGFQQPEYVPYVDYPTWLNLALKGKLYAVNSYCGCWRRHRDQVTANKSIEMEIAHGRYSLEFYDHLPEQAKTELSFTRENLIKNNNMQLAAVYAGVGRMDLVKQKWLEATNNFQRALRDGNTYVKLKAIAGIICSKMKINMEWAAFLLGKRIYDDVLR